MGIADKNPGIIPLIFSMLNEDAIMKILTHEEQPNTTLLEIFILKDNKDAMVYLLEDLSEENRIALMDLREQSGRMASSLHLAFAATRNSSAIEYLVRGLSDTVKEQVLLEEYLIDIAAKEQAVASNISAALPSQYQETFKNAINHTTNKKKFSKT